MKAQVHRDGGTEGGEFVDDLERMVADVDFRRWMTPWVLKLVSLTLIVRPKISNALLMSLCNAASEGSIVNEDHVTIKYSFEFGLGTEVAYVEEFRCGYESHTARGGVKGRGQKEREEDSKECVVAKTQPGFFKAHGSRHVFMVGDEHAEEFGKLEQTLSAH